MATDGGVTRVYPARFITFYNFRKTIPSRSMAFLSEKSVFLCSAGSEWTGQAETYESSFYKRSLDNDLYVFTPLPFTGNSMCVCLW